MFDFEIISIHDTGFVSDLSLSLNRKVINPKIVDFQDSEAVILFTKEDINIIKNKNITCFEQPVNSGKTYLSKEFNRDVITFIQSDFNDDWLKKALNKQRSF